MNILKKRMKRLMAWMVTLGMVFSMLPVSVHAEDDLSDPSMDGGVYDSTNDGTGDGTGDDTVENANDGMVDSCSHGMGRYSDYGEEGHVFVCDSCGWSDDAPIPHSYSDGYCWDCDHVCNHRNLWGVGVCSDCGYECEHEFGGGYCRNCGVPCPHADCWWEDTGRGHTEYCEDCNFVVGYEEHCWDDGVCAVCGAECSHEWGSNGVCTTCGSSCNHRWDNDGICVDCGAEANCRQIAAGRHAIGENGVCGLCGTQKIRVLKAFMSMSGEEISVGNLLDGDPETGKVIWEDITVEVAGSAALDSI